jgi:thiamine-phosphate pyrophosphorylase
MYLGGLCFITDQKASGLSYEVMTSIVLKNGVRCVQFREKERSRREIYKEAIRLRSLTRHYNAAFIINDFLDIAVCVDADGVHLGQDDLPLKEARKIAGRNRIIGISTHNLKQAKEAEKNGADYVGFGPVFSTSTKDAGKPKGIEMLHEVKNHVRIPVVAIGGINPENVMSVLEAGVDAIAVASSILQGDIGENAKRFIDCLKG